MIKYKKGNIFDFIYEENLEVILHGCNCFCKMDDGIALQFALNFPEIVLSDNLTNLKDKNKLGTYHPVNIKRFDKEFTILNCYTQFAFAGFDIETFDYFDYEAFENILKDVKTNFSGKKLGMPLIGSGHAGGDVSKILTLIHQYLNDEDVLIALYNTNSLPPQYSKISNQLVITYDEFIKKFKSLIS